MPKNSKDDKKIVQNINIKIGDSNESKTLKKKKRSSRKKKLLKGREERVAPTKKEQSKPFMSNYQFPAVLYREVGNTRPANTSTDQQKQDEKLAQKFQQKFDEEFAKRENEKATKKSATAGAFQSVDDGYGFSQEVSRAEKRFVNDSSRSTNTTIQPDNIFQRSNLLYADDKVDQVDQVAEAVVADTIDNPSVYCEVCGGRYKKGTKKTHYKTKKHMKAEAEFLDIPALETVDEEEPPFSNVNPMYKGKKTVSQLDNLDNLVTNTLSNLVTNNTLRNNLRIGSNNSSDFENRVGDDVENDFRTALMQPLEILKNKTNNEDLLMNN